jgi:hypothetical protein
MPLQDHFHPPLSLRRHWHSFHNAWATYLSSDLNKKLPAGYFAEPNVQFGIEIDVATFAEPGVVSFEGPGWTPPAPVQTLPFTLVGDIVEVAIYSSTGGPTLAGAVELVSPANKDQPESRDAFLCKCQSYLQHGIGLVIADVVTERRSSFHNELLARIAATSARLIEADLYAAAYRPLRQDNDVTLQVWQEGLAIGQALPTMPLWLRGGLCLSVDLEATYERTCKEQRISVLGA